MYDVIMMFENYKYKVVLISFKLLKISIDEKIVSITKEDLDNLFRILRYFDIKNNSKVIDSIKYNITINNEIYEGDSSSNKNFSLLNDWLGDINDR